MNFIESTENKIKAKMGVSPETPLVCLKNTNNGKNFLGLQVVSGYPEEKVITKRSKCIRDLVLARIKDREQVREFGTMMESRKSISLPELAILGANINKSLILGEPSKVKKRSFNEAEPFRIKQDF